MAGSIDNNSHEEWTVGKVLKAMSGPGYPEFVLDIVDQIQAWMSDWVDPEGSWEQQDYPYSSMGNGSQGDIEKLLSQLKWVESYADMMPSERKPSGGADAVVLCMGAAELDDGMRAAIDYGSLFARGRCKRIWLISDGWIPGDVFRYVHHVDALEAQGVSFHYILVTPWGWMEIPLGRSPFTQGRLTWKNPAGEGQPHEWKNKNDENGKSKLT